MALHSLTRSRVGDSVMSIAVHDTAIRIAVAGTARSTPALMQGDSTDIRRTAYALLSAAEELDQVKQQTAARAGAAEDETPR